MIAVGIQGALLMQAPALHEKKTLSLQGVLGPYLPMMALWKISANFSEMTNGVLLGSLMAESVSYCSSAFMS